MSINKGVKLTITASVFWYNKAIAKQTSKK